MKTLILLLFVLFVLSSTDTYPSYKQCDDRWGAEQMGISFYDLCEGGDLVTCLAMASPQEYNPGTLNKWLKQNNKYISGYIVAITSLNGIGLIYQGKIANSNIKQYIDNGYVVIGQVPYGYVLIQKYEGNNLFIHDPTKNNKQSYDIKDFIDGQTIVYKQQKKQISM